MLDRLARTRPLDRRLHRGIVRRHEGDLVPAVGGSLAPAV